MIFLSYSHRQSAYADRIGQYLNQRHMAVLHDRHDEKETDSISRFVRRVGEADLVILLISDAYLKSYYCLYEALLAYSHRDRKNLIPILCPDADVLSHKGQARYLTYWRWECRDRRETLEAMPGAAAVELRRELRQVEAYCNYLGDFLAYLKDTVCIRQADGEGALEALYRCLCGKLLDREVRYRQNGLRSTAPFAVSEKPCLALDFGTSYTLMAVLDTKGKSHLIPSCTGSWIHRSSIEFMPNGDYRVGSDSPRALRHIKRSIGLRETVNINGEPWSIRLLIAMILKSMVRNAEEYLGVEVGRVVLSMPTDFGLAQKRILAESARIAGIQVARFVQESSVESFLSKNDRNHFAAFIDMGGGTLDITLSDVGDGVLEVLYSDGDSGFGSLEFDRKLEKLLEQKLRREYGVAGENLEVLAEQVKCRLGEHAAVTVTHLSEDAEGNLRILPLTVTRKEFEEAAQTHIHAFREKLRKLDEFRKAEEKRRGIPLEVIYLTGQGTKLYVLKQLLRDLFPDIEVVDRYQENAVIRGLCHQLAMFEGFAHKLLMSTLPGTILVRSSEKEENIISPGCNPKKTMLLDEDTTIPTRKAMVFSFEFAQGESLPREFPVEILERTVSGREYDLASAFVTAEPEKQYELTVDIDANLNVRLTLKQCEANALCMDIRI